MNDVVSRVPTSVLGRFLWHACGLCVTLLLGTGVGLGFGVPATVCSTVGGGFLLLAMFRRRDPDRLAQAWPEAHRALVGRMRVRRWVRYSYALSVLSGLCIGGLAA